MLMSPSASQDTDADLATAHLAGDPAAFERLVERYAPPLIGYMRRLTGSDDDAQDISQETFVRLFKNIAKLDLSQPLKPWLFRVATNLCRNLAKRKKFILFSQLAKEEEGDSSSLLETTEDTEPTPAETLLRSTQAATIRNAIEHLPQKYQVVISLYYWNDLSYEEMANVLSLPLNTVRTHLKRAKQQLASSLEHGV